MFQSSSGGWLILLIVESKSSAPAENLVLQVQILFWCVNSKLCFHKYLHTQLWNSHWVHFCASQAWSAKCSQQVNTKKGTNRAEMVHYASKNCYRKDKGISWNVGKGKSSHKKIKVGHKPRYQYRNAFSWWKVRQTSNGLMNIHSQKNVGFLTDIFNWNTINCGGCRGRIWHQNIQFYSNWVRKRKSAVWRTL